MYRLFQLTIIRDKHLRREASYAKAVLPPP